jgi:hypothetical protein
MNAADNHIAIGPFEIIIGFWLMLRGIRTSSLPAPTA